MQLLLRKKTLAITIVIWLTAGLLTPVWAFPDTRGHWANEDIEFLQTKSIIGGYPDGNYRPEQGVTRAELARLIIAALNMEDSAWALEASTQLFRDVPLDHWARGYIHLAWELGIVSGYKDGNFHPEAIIRRDEMASMLIRALRYIGNGQNQKEFADWQDIPEWARESIELASRWGLISGFEDDTFRAGEPVSRAQAAVFINRLMAERGSQFDLYGSVSSSKNNKLEMEVNGKVRQFELSNQAVIFSQGEQLSLQELPGKLPGEALAALNPEGRVVFVKLLPQPLAPNVTLALSKYQEGAGEAVGSQNYGLLNNRLEEETEDPQRGEREPWKSLNVTREAMGAEDLERETGADGSRQVIAIIDTGVDPGHPDLQFTSDDREKIIDWVNLTTEGLVTLTGQIPAGSTRLSHEGVTYTIGHLNSQSGVYKYGFLSEQEQQVDFDLDGKQETDFLVVVTDSRVKGVYDSVIIDTNGDRSLEDELKLKAYGTARHVGTFLGEYGNKFNFVISEIDPTGKQVVFGYDQNGHGTQVAGVAAANGRIQGIAPGAQLIVIKVLDYLGETDWERLEKAIRYAADRGADVINLSLGYYQDESAGNNTLTRVVDELSQQGIVFTIAAGNKGPGVGTISTPGNAKGAVSIGAYITPEMWENDYGYEVAKESVWYFSSAGPRQDGLMVPSVVAPGSAVSTWPLWTGDGYKLGEGTSIASPHAAGAAALLLDSARRQGLQVDPEMIKRAFALGARELKSFSAAEIGYGVLDVNQAWRNLRRLDPQVPLRGYAYNRRLGFGEGLFSREIIPGQVPYRVTNQGTQNEVLFWTSTAKWLNPWFQMTSLPQGAQRELPVDYVLPEEPGIYTGFLQGYLLSTYGPDVNLMTTIIKPYLLEKDNGYRQEFAESLPAGQYRRYFLKVPEGAAVLQVVLSVPQEGAEDYRGRTRLHLIKPNGEQHAMTDWTGLAPEGMPRREWANMAVESPEAGIWELVVYSSAALSTYDRRDSQYRLRVQLTGVSEPESAQADSRYLLNVVPKKLEPGKPNYITVTVRDKDNYKPVEGMLTINNQLYQVKNGQVTLAVIPKTEEIKLEIGL